MVGGGRRAVVLACGRKHLNAEKCMPERVEAPPTNKFYDVVFLFGGSHPKGGHHCVGLHEAISQECSGVPRPNFFRANKA
eukprot:62450-Pelagomonas_calceolata.AAC.5